FSSAMTVAVSILECCSRAVMDIGGYPVCARGLRESVRDSKSGAASRREQRLNFAFQAISLFKTILLNAHWDGLLDYTLGKQKRKKQRQENRRVNEQSSTHSRLQRR